MSNKTYVEQDGITTRYRVSISAPFTKEDMALMGQSLNDSTFDVRLLRIKIWARGTLEAAGYPTRSGTFTQDSSGKWVAVGDEDNIDALAKEGKVRDRLVTIIERDGKYTQEWYAASFIEKLEFLETMIERSEIKEAAKFAYDLGLLVAEAEIKCDWESDALRGLKVRQNEGGAQRPEYQQACRERWASWQIEADEYWRRRPSASKAEVAAAIARKFDSNLHTIRQRIKKPDELPG